MPTATWRGERAAGRLFPLGLLAVLLGGPGGALAADRAGVAPDPARPTVVFVVLDTVRADHLSLCGYARPTTPTLEELARLPGASFTCRAYAPGSWTLPSHASFFTGLEVPEHRAAMFPGGIGIGGSRASPLGAEWPTLAERMAEAGYLTVSLSSNPVVAERAGLVRGFRVWFAPQHFGPLYGRSFVLRLGAILRRRVPPAASLFLFLNIADAHTPLDAVPEGLDWVPPQRRFPMPYGFGTPPSRYVRGELDEDGVRELREHYTDAYDYGIFRADRTLGDALELLRERGWLGGAYRIIVTSDHGEYLAEHGLVGHDSYIFEPNNRVPLLHVRGRGEALALPEPISARSVFSLVLEDALPAAALPVSAVGYPNVDKQKTFQRNDLFRDTAVALWRGHSKWLWVNGRTQHFDLLRDAAEARPSAVPAPEVPAELDALARQAVRVREAGVERESPELQEQLEALGYVH